MNGVVRRGWLALVMSACLVALVCPWVARADDGPPTPIGWPQLGLTGRVELLGANEPTEVNLPVPQGVSPGIVTGTIGPAVLATGRVDVTDGHGVALAASRFPARPPPSRSSSRRTDPDSPSRTAAPRRRYWSSPGRATRSCVRSTCSPTAATAFRRPRRRPSPPRTGVAPQRLTPCPSPTSARRPRPRYWASVPCSSVSTPRPSGGSGQRREGAPAGEVDPRHQCRRLAADPLRQRRARLGGAGSIGQGRPDRRRPGERDQLQCRPGTGGSLRPAPGLHRRPGPHDLSRGLRLDHHGLPGRHRAQRIRRAANGFHTGVRRRTR